ncbi:hypothetical protein H4R33_000593 [Dimargaris cristalligena]|uniref:Uncharacterized protein n=1 Tax=Dimargaris cristalligena TaxID=215637 RepID=A0A4Q0A1A0_9FUNG|nr:hypothetical protein H4R33_000593 [Dimargaris cristalligena]RKP39835.1 hypothetical protein BJ085DRAFT_33388 [Dimargaris cristalligena]|eukprot:RKP39835.1 hypothetical protein BJ085DRAFT_33388 [Dimargaris cristalligena]
MHAYSLGLLALAASLMAISASPLPSESGSHGISAANAGHLSTNAIEDFLAHIASKIETLEDKKETALLEATPPMMDEEIHDFYDEQINHLKNLYQAWSDRS